MSIDTKVIRTPLQGYPEKTIDGSELSAYTKLGQGAYGIVYKVFEGNLQYLGVG